VVLKDFAISAPSTLNPGSATFSISNQGPSLHELVIMKTDLSPRDLPTTLEGGVAVVDEQSPALQAVDEKEDIAPGSTVTLRVTLGPGHYVLVCNIPAHFEQGMSAEITVGA